MHSTRECAAALRRSRVFRISLLALAVVLGAGSTLAAGSAPVRAAAATTEVRILLNGYGDVAVTGGPAPYTCTNKINADQSDAGGCRLTVPVGTKLTFKATPKPVQGPELDDPVPDPPVTSEFRSWSRGECTSAGPCTVKTAAPEEWVVAQFSPVWLEALVTGPGTITAGGVQKTCAFDCQFVIGLFNAGKPVTVTGVPTKAGAATKWGFGCDPSKSSLANGRCVLGMALDRNFVSVGFDGEIPRGQPPYNRVVHLRVEVSGEGQVQGSGKSADLDAEPWSIDCGGACDVDRLQAQTEVRLLAEEADGSVFVRWAGPPCLSQDTCTFTAGKYPKAVAVFKKKKTIGAFSAVVLSAEARGSGSTRAVVLRLRTNAPARASLRLLRNGHSLGRKSFDVAAGTRLLRLPVAAGVKPGWTALAIEVVGAAGTKRTFRKWLQLGA